MHLNFFHACVRVHILDQLGNILSVYHLIGKLAYVVHGIWDFVEAEADLAHDLELAEEFEISEMPHILHGQLEHAQIFEEGRDNELPLL